MPAQKKTSIREENLSEISGVESEKVLSSLAKELDQKVKKTEPALRGEIEIKGDWGEGETVEGELCCLPAESTIFDLKEEFQDKILAINGCLERGFWHKAKSLGVKGIVCGGLPDEKFTEEVGQEFLLVDGKPRRLSLPLVVLGKKGRIPPDAWELLEVNQGEKVFLIGDEQRLLLPKKKK